MIQAKNIGIKTAIEEMKRMRLSKRLRMHYDAYWKAKRDAWAIEDYQKEQLKKAVEQGTAEALEKGMEQGIEKGIEKGMAEGLEKGIAKGMEEGLAQGMTQGETRMAMLYKSLLADNRLSDLQRVTEDRDYREQLYRKYDI